MQHESNESNELQDEGSSTPAKKAKKSDDTETRFPNCYCLPRSAPPPEVHTQSSYIATCIIYLTIFCCSKERHAVFIKSTECIMKIQG